MVYRLSWWLWRCFGQLSTHSSTAGGGRLSPATYAGFYEAAEWLQEADVANIVIASVSIEGTRPILWNAFGPWAIPASGKRERSGVAGNDPEEWRRTVLVTDDRQLYVRPTYIFSCLVAGAKFTPRRRGSLQPWLAATLLILDRIVLIDRFLPDPLTTDESQPVYLDVQSVVNPGTRARNIRYRVAASEGWRTDWRMSWDKTVVSSQEVHAATIDAGRLVGLGNGRGIGLGRFQVVEFETHNEA